MTITRSSKLRSGEWVEVRSKEEILRTLDEKGQLDGLPFMPEMFQHCGARVRVSKRAHKTCDPPSGLQARRMAEAVHLTDVRCGGEFHGGCQAGCLIFWKDAWLKRVGGDESGRLEAAERPSGDGVARCREEDVFAGVLAGAAPGGADTVYVCQSTRLSAATSPLPWWSVRQYVEDLRSGNVRVSQMLAAALFVLYHALTESGLGFGAALRGAYDALQKARGRTPYPLRRSRLPEGTPTPAATLALRAGDTVSVRSYPEILETLDQGWRNRGLYFDPEQVPFCNGTYRVLRRVERIIDEKTGRLVRFTRDAIILDDVACQARYAKCRHFCSRSIYPFWREIWLRRAP